MYFFKMFWAIMIIWAFFLNWCFSWLWNKNFILLILNLVIREFCELFCITNVSYVFLTLTLLCYLYHILKFFIFLKKNIWLLLKLYLSYDVDRKKNIEELEREIMINALKLYRVFFFHKSIIVFSFMLIFPLEFGSAFYPIIHRFRIITTIP